MVAIDFRRRVPIYLQIVEEYERLISLGILKNDSPMPSVRQLAIDLSVNPNTIQKAYRELEKRGLIYSVYGRGSFVAMASDNVIELKINEFRNELLKLIKQSEDNGISKDTLRAILLEMSDMEGME